MKPGPRAAWAGGLLVFCVLVGLGWLTWRPRAATPAAPTAMAPAVVSVATSVGTALPAAVAVVRAASASTGSSAVAASQASAPTARTTWELCGVGEVPMPRQGLRDPQPFEDMPSPLGEHAVAAAWGRVLARLEASASVQDRAAALLLRRSGPAAAASVQLQSGPDENTVSRATEALALLAQRTTDPVVVRWALRACDLADVPPACASLSPRDLLRLEPADALAWIALAATEPATREASLRNAVRADRHRSHDLGLAAVVDAAVPTDLPPYLRPTLLMHAMGVERSLGVMPYAALPAHCPVAMPDDPSRRALCAELAALLVERGDSVLALLVGSRIGERAGWPAARVAGVRAEANSLSGNSSTWAIEGTLSEAPHGCKSVEAFRHVMKRHWQVGELSAPRELATQKKTAAPR